MNLLSNYELFRLLVSSYSVELDHLTVMSSGNMRVSMKIKNLSSYKKKKLTGIIVNVAIATISYLFVKLDWLSIIPVFTLAGGFLMAVAHSINFLFNYDEEESVEAFLQNDVYITSNRKRFPDSKK